MQNKETLKKAAIVILAAVLLLFPTVVSDPYVLHILISIFIWSILTMGIRIVLIPGHLNAAQATFMGMGAYASGILAMKLGWSFWVSLPLAGVVTALLAAIVGMPTLRIKGSYFVILTLGVSEVFRHVWMMWDSLFGGPQGLLGIPTPDPISLGGLTIGFNSKVHFYYLALILFAITATVMRRFDLSRVGLILRAIPQSDVLAECSGVNLMKYKLTAFIVSAFFAGVAGSFWAHYFTYCSPMDFTLGQSFTMIMYVVMGGTGTILGPILGASVMLALDEWLRPFKEFMPIILGAILIVVLLFVPGGLISIPARIRNNLKRRAL